jgi:hypothetical protein
MKKLFVIVLFVAALAALAIPGDAPAAVANVGSTWINGSQVYYQMPYRMRWLDVIGVDAIQYTQGFSSLPVDDTTGDPTEWTWSPVEIGAGTTTGVITTVAGGEFLITNAGNDDDGVNMQLKGESFKCEDGKSLYFGIKIKMSHATLSELFIGVGITDTLWSDGITDGIYFEKLAAGTGVSAVTEDTGETQTDNVAVMDTSYHIYEFYYDGVLTTDATAGTVTFWVDGVQVAQHTTAANITIDTEITPTIEFTNGDAVVRTANIDWINVVHPR